MALRLTSSGQTARMPSAIATASFGLSNGARNFERAAARVVRTTTLGEGDPVRAVADTIESRAQVQANAKVLKSADDALGRLLDILA